MIYVDTSVWVSAIRRPAAADALKLKALLDADEVAVPLPVRIELFSGIAKQNRTAFRRAMSALPVALPTDETWQQLQRWTAEAADAGLSFSVADLLIAALASERGGLVWSLDRDFEAMEKLGFVRCY